MIDTAARDALNVLGYFYLSNQKLTEALAILEGLHVLCPDDIQVAKTLACARFAYGESKNALELTTQLLPKVNRPEDRAVLQVIQGRALAALGEKDRARKILEDVLQNTGAPS